MKIGLQYVVHLFKKKCLACRLDIAGSSAFVLPFMGQNIYIYYPLILIKFIINKIIKMIFILLSYFTIIFREDYIFYNNIKNYFMNYYYYYYYYYYI